MPSVELNHLQSALANAHSKIETTIVEKTQRFQRYATKRMQRLQREGQNNQGALLRALSDSLGFVVPQSMSIVAKPDGSATLEWQGADPRVKAEEPPAAPDLKILAPEKPVEIPANGQHELAPV